MSTQATIRHGDHGTDLRGVRGWLLLLCLFLMIVMPLVAILGMIGALQRAAAAPALGTVLLPEIVVELALAAFSIYAGWALYRMRPNAVRVARAYFITILALSIFGLVMLLAAGAAQSESQSNALIDTLRGPAVVAGIRQILIAAVCLLYLQRSKRVRATYPKV